MAFGRLERARAPSPMSDINMTPLIDVMLVLLVIFMITAPLMTTSLKMELPKTAAGVVDLGPGAGPAGGRVVAMGPPEAVAEVEASLTGRWLAPLLEHAAATAG